MKKNNSILKALGILFLIFVALSWIIPAGYFSNGEYVKDAISPIGLFDIILYPLAAITSSVFILSALIFILIGAFYGVLNKTKAYPKLVENLAKKFKGKETVVLVVTSLVFIILTSLTSLTLPMFVFVPLFATILMLLGYSKFTSMLATVGSILVGNMASTYGSNVAGYVKYLTESMNIGMRLIFLVLAAIVFVIFLVKTSNTKSNDKDIMLYQKTTKKVSSTPVVVIMILVLIFSLVGMFDWSNVFGVKLFTNIHDAIVGFKIGDYTLFENLMGSMTAIGTWTNYQLAMILLIATFVVGKIYKLKFSEIVEGAIEGIKEMLPVALIAIVANVIFLLMNVNSNGYTFYNSIANTLVGTKIGIVPFGTATFIGSIFYNDFPYFLSGIYGSISSLSDQYVLIGMISQLVHGLVQLIAPTSVILVAGLTYFKIPYTTWLKQMWKCLLCMLAIIIIFLIFV